MVKAKLCNCIGTFEKSHIRFSVTEPTRNRSSFYQSNYKMFGWWFGTANTNCQNFIKNAFKIVKLQSLIKKIQINVILSTVLKEAVVTKTGNDHKPPQTSTNDHKRPQISTNHHKPLTNVHKPQANYHKPPANKHKIPRKPFPNSSQLSFFVNWKQGGT